MKKIILGVLFISQVGSASESVMTYNKDQQIALRNGRGGSIIELGCGQKAENIDQVQCYSKKTEVPSMDEFQELKNELSKTQKLQESQHNSVTEKIKQTQESTYAEIQSSFKTLLQDEGFKKFVEAIVAAEITKINLIKGQ